MLEQIVIPETKQASLDDIGSSTILIDNRTPVNSYVQKLREKTLKQVELKEVKTTS